MRRCMGDNTGSFGFCLGFAKSFVLKVWSRINFIPARNTDCQWSKSSSNHKVGWLWALIVVNYGPAGYWPRIVRLFCCKQAVCKFKIYSTYLPN